MKERAERNRTISLTKDEYTSLSQRLLVLKDRAMLDDIFNKTINNNLFDIIDFLPKEFADLKTKR